MVRQFKGLMVPEIARRDDWAAVENIELVDGKPATKWHNLVTAETAVLREGIHPLDNPNSIQSMALAAALAPPEPEPDEEPADRVAVLLSALKGGESRADVKIYRIKPDGGEAWCGSQSPEEFEARGYEYIAQNWGAGRYRITLYATNPDTGKFARRGSQIIDIEKSLQTAVAGAVPVSVNPMSQIADVLALMKTMREALGVTSAPAAPPPTPAQTMKELAETLGLMRQIRDEIEPTPEPSDPLTAALPGMLELVKTAMVAQTSPAQAIQIPSSMQIAASERAEESEAMMQLNFFISTFNKRAQAGASVEESAEQICNFAPEELLQIIESNDWFEKLSTLAPAIAPHRAWYEKVRSRVVALLNEPDSEGTD